MARRSHAPVTPANLLSAPCTTYAVKLTERGRGEQMLLLHLCDEILLLWGKEVFDFETWTRAMSLYFGASLLSAAARSPESAGVPSRRVIAGTSHEHR